MGDIVIREVRGQELFAASFPLRAYAFDGSPGAAEPDKWVGHATHLAACSVFVLFEDGIPLATATSVPLTQSVRGKILPGAGIAFVATAPGARRQGHQTRVIARLLETMRERGEVVAALHPSRESFYARFGFVGFPNVALAQIAPSRLAPLVRQDLPGEVELVPLRDGLDRYRAYLSTVQRQMHGFALADQTFSGFWRDGADSWLAFAHVDGEVAGAMTYAISRFGGELHADEFLAAGVAKYLLLRWLGVHAEQVATISVILPAADRLETWFVDLRAAIGFPDPPVRLTPVARIVSLDAIDGLRVGEGAFTVRIVDRWCRWNEGTFRFASEDGLLGGTPVADADCAVTIDGISALVYGGYDPDDFSVRGWGSPPAATRAAMRSMFPPALPFLYERF
jgi:predicted acetyltransferase